MPQQPELDETSFQSAREQGKKTNLYVKPVRQSNLAVPIKRDPITHKPIDSPVSALSLGHTTFVKSAAKERAPHAKKPLVNIYSPFSAKHVIPRLSVNAKQSAKPPALKDSPHRPLLSPTDRQAKVGEETGSPVSEDNRFLELSHRSVLNSAFARQSFPAKAVGDGTAERKGRVPLPLRPNDLRLDRVGQIFRMVQLRFREREERRGLGVVSRPLPKFAVTP